LESRALDKDQIRTLKNLCDRLERFHRLWGRRRQAFGAVPVHAHGRPWRDQIAREVQRLRDGLRYRLGDVLAANDVQRAWPSPDRTELILVDEPIV
jgi:hypothetical protein